jgi:hypothetical protein
MGILLSGYLPDEGRQGISALEEALRAEPDRRVVVVGVLEQYSLTEYRGVASDKEPTLTLRWALLEAVEGGDAQSVESLLRSAAASRKPQQELAIDEAAMTGDDTTSREPKQRGRRGSVSPLRPRHA